MQWSWHKIHFYRAYLERLEKNGYIRRDPTKPRAIEDPGRYHTSQKGNRKYAVVGQVTAGKPMPLKILKTLSRCRPIYCRMAMFLLSVKGDSMIEAGIFDGDYVIVKQQSYADNGDIVVALIDDEATVKAFYKEKDHRGSSRGIPIWPYYS